MKGNKLLRFILSASVILLFMSTENLISQTLFEINNFKANESDIQLLGASSFKDNIVRLTPNVKNKAGACWFKSQKIDLNSGFYMDFEFRISENDAENGGGDGFAFVIQNQNIDSLGGLGDKIGYKNFKNAVAIELDTYDNEEESKNHVCLSIYNSRKDEYIPFATVHEIPEVNDGDSHFARMEYRDGQLIFYLDTYIFPILTVDVDLDSLVQADNGQAWVGFTSATSFATANHDLLSWTLSQYQEPPSLNVSNVDVEKGKTINVYSRKLDLVIWDNNVIDGDTISLKVGEDWILSNYPVTKDKKRLQYTLRGFETELILYAHNTGQIPPNTAAILIDDGINPHQLKLSSNLTSAESVKIRYKAKGLKKENDR